MRALSALRGALALLVVGLAAGSSNAGAQSAATDGRIPAECATFERFRDLYEGKSSVPCEIAGQTYQVKREHVAAVLQSSVTWADGRLNWTKNSSNDGGVIYYSEVNDFFECNRLDRDNGWFLSGETTLRRSYMSASGNYATYLGLGLERSAINFSSAHDALQNVEARRAVSETMGDVIRGTVPKCVFVDSFLKRLGTVLESGDTAAVPAWFPPATGTGGTGGTGGTTVNAPPPCKRSDGSTSGNPYDCAPRDSEVNCSVIDIPCNFRKFFLPSDNWNMRYRTELDKFRDRMPFAVMTAFSSNAYGGGEGEPMHSYSGVPFCTLTVVVPAPSLSGLGEQGRNVDVCGSPVYKAWEDNLKTPVTALLILGVMWAIFRLMVKS